MVMHCIGNLFHVKLAALAVLTLSAYVTTLLQQRQRAWTDASDGAQVHTYEELTNSFRDVSSKCHSLISDGGKEITKLLSSSNRTLKVSKGAPAWKAYVDYIGDIVIDGLVECIIASVHRLTSQVCNNF